MENKPGAIIIEGHVQGLSNTRSLGESGIPVYVVDKTNCIARYSRYCKKFFICPDFQTDAFADFLITLAKEEKLSGWVLIPSNDHAVYTISRYKQNLSSFYKIITPDLEITEQIYDKRNLLLLAEKLQLPFPRTQYFLNAEEEAHPGLTFPVITKGRNGLSFYKAIGKKAFLAGNLPELSKQLRQISESYPVEGTFTQELIPFDGKNKTISFTAFCISGEIKSFWMGVKLREHPLRFGTATFAKSVFVRECYDQSVPLLKSLDYSGVCEVEYLFDPRDGKYKLIEINARTWLWVGLAKACGVNYAKMIYDHVNDIPIDFPSRYTLNLKWMNPVSDLIFSIMAILTLQLNPLTYLKTVLNNDVVNALGYRGDNKPQAKYLTSLFSFLKNR